MNEAAARVFYKRQRTAGTAGGRGRLYLELGRALAERSDVALRCLCRRAIRASGNGIRRLRARTAVGVGNATNDGALLGESGADVYTGPIVRPRTGVPTVATVQTSRSSGCQRATGCPSALLRLPREDGEGAAADHCFRQAVAGDVVRYLGVAPAANSRGCGGPRAGLGPASSRNGRFSGNHGLTAAYLVLPRDRRAGERAVDAIRAMVAIAPAPGGVLAWPATRAADTTPFGARFSAWSWKARCASLAMSRMKNWRRC